MVVTRKHDGTPRRTVDLSPLNKYCEREAHSSKSPFHLARSVPSGSVMTVCDVWNGYHAVPIREEDRQLTTFTTPWGLFRYKRAPQGFLSSGDGFNRRFDDIAAHIVRMERCVDDSLLHDTDLEEHWWRVIDFLELVGKTGMIITQRNSSSPNPLSTLLDSESLTMSWNLCLSTLMPSRTSQGQRTSPIFSAGLVS